MSLKCGRFCRKQGSTSKEIAIQVTKIWCLIRGASAGARSRGNIIIVQARAAALVIVSNDIANAGGFSFLFNWVRARHPLTAGDVIIAPWEPSP